MRLPLLAILGLIRVSIAAAQAAAAPAASPSDIFYSIAALGPTPDLGTSVIGGTPANPADWPASFYSLRSDSACTATLVGPRALLTAAHCVAGREPQVQWKGQLYKTTCTVSPLYSDSTETGRSADWALCAVEQPIIVVYETIADSPPRFGVTTRLLLTGFGCTEPDLSAGNDGIFRTAVAPVESMPTDGSQSNFIITKVPVGGPTLCPGDSGGGAFLVGANVARRVQVSVNSMTYVQRTLHGPVATGTSYLASLATPAAREFLATWVKDNQLDVCGLGYVTNCRQGPEARHYERK